MPAGKLFTSARPANLSNRVRSYFQPSAKLEPKTQQQVAEVKELEFFITNSEYEALILENNLIKRYRPFYNIRLKDDKGYPYIKINLREDWPTVSYTREMRNDGARYFGPFTNSWSVKQTLKVLEGIFPLPLLQQANYRHRETSLSEISPRPLPGALHRVRQQRGI